MDYQPAYKEITLEKFQIGVSQRIPTRLLDQRIDVSLNYIADYMDVQVRGYIWGEEVDRIEIVYPEDWKESFKERWFPDWLKEKFPVKYHKHTIDVRALYPNFLYALPKEQHTLKLVVTETWGLPK